MIGLRRRAKPQPAAVAGVHPLQTGAMTLLLALAGAPLLPELKPEIGLFFTALLVLRLVSLRWPALSLNAWVLASLTGLGGINVIDAYHGLAGREPGAALLLTMAALKLLEVRTERDLRVLATVFVFLALVEFLFHSSAIMAAYVALLLLGNLALMAHLGRVVDAGAGAYPALRTAGMLTLQGLPLALMLFVLFPRLDAPLWDLGLDSDQARTGLKNWLEPGAVTELVVSGEDAFRARFDEPLAVKPDALYWRGPVLWRTDGRRWTPLPEHLQARGGASVTPLSAKLEYTVVLEPSDQRWLLALDLAVSVPEGAVRTNDFQLVATRPIDDLRVYRTGSVLKYRTSGLGAGERAAALQLPSNITPRMRRLVAGWTGDDPPQWTVVQRALRFFNREPFRYTLVPPPLGDNVADAFLFETQSGFCEHYASSFVLLMRIAGIPSRIVAGYLGGEYNPISDDYVVRQSDAHAWAEVWIDGRGWVRVDPTGAVAADRVERDGRIAGLGAAAPVRFRVDRYSGLGRVIHGARLLADALDSGWTNWVLGYSGRRQQRLLEVFGLEDLRQYGLAVLMGIATLGIMAVWSLTLARRRGPDEPVLRAWQRFCGKLSRIGLGRAPEEGPLAYVARIVSERPDLAEEVEPIVTAYVAIRYAPAADGDALARLEQRVRRFRPGRRRAYAGPEHRE